jgi:hypothetical protein
LSSRDAAIARILRFVKYLFILAAFAGFAAWWWQMRRAAVRERLRREARTPSMLLERCPKCGTFAAKEGHTCG